MTKQQHPITPPPELVQQWRKSGPADAAVNNAYEQHIATQAARWGADQELDACRKWVDAEFPTYPKCDGPASYRLADARRPKPPSLKEQALAALSRLNSGALCANPTVDKDTIRRALEQLDD